MSGAERITSRHNPLAVHIRKLNASRAYRREQGQFLCEGPKLLEECLRAQVEIQTLVAAQGQEYPCPLGARYVEVPEELLQSLSDTVTPQGVLAVCRLPELAPPETLTGRRYLLLDGVQDPGNLGTIWRTADAFGADGLLLVNGCADPYGPKTVRATMGAAFRLPAWETDLTAGAALLRAAGMPIYAAALQEDTLDVRKIDLTASAVVIGSEGRGVSAQALELCDGTMKIPMRGRCESLNAAVAAAVVLWEMARGD